MKYLLLILLSFSISYSQDVQTRVVTEDLDTPWDLVWGPDGHIWYTERYGKISKVDPETGEKTLLLDHTSTVYERSESGMMGLCIHPDFENNPYVYVVYTYQTDRIRNRLSRFTYNGSSLGDEQIIYDQIYGNTTHDGARVIIDPDDMTLYMTMGDSRLESDNMNAQDISTPNGKTLRFNLDGSAPDDNPFVNEDGANPYVWNYGHRNQQGLVKANGILYSAEHGANIADELNIEIKGDNYGWPVVEGYCTTQSEKTFCDENNVHEPLFEYEANRTKALCGIDYYGDGPITEFQNSILLVALKDADVSVAKLNEDGTEVLESNLYFRNQFGRLRDVCVSPDGRVFLATSNQDGRGRSPFNQQSDRIIEIKANTTSIKKNDDEILIYPNPSNGRFHIRSDFDLNNISVFNMIGELIYQNEIRSGEELDLNKMNIVSGQYLIKINNNVQQIVITK